MQELIPFDYDLIKQGYKVVTRDGREVKQLTLFNTAKENEFAGVVSGELKTFEFSGRYYLDGTLRSQYDLFMAPPTTVKYINIYPETNECYQYPTPRSLRSDKPNSFNLKVTYQADKPISVELI